jgi:hypothetical protein
VRQGSRAGGWAIATGSSTDYGAASPTNAPRAVIASDAELLTLVTQTELFASHRSCANILLASHERLRLRHLGQRCQARDGCRPSVLRCGGEYGAARVW